MKRLDTASVAVHNAAADVAAGQGVSLITIVIDEKGAYRIRNSEMNINTAIGVLCRATMAYERSKRLSRPEENGHT